MKKIMGIILTLIAVNSFAGEIPEAKSLHPELYTIQVSFARFPTPDNVAMSDKEFKRAFEEYEILIEDYDFEEEFEDEDRKTALNILYARVMDKALLNHIESSKEVEYKDLATIYTRLGEPFTGADSKVKGLIDLESNTLVIFEFNFPEYYENKTESTNNRFYVNEWFDGGSRKGGKNSGYVLIKCYPPTNVPSNQKLDPSAVKTSGDPVNEQGTAAEL
jgi:hypothetical protein